MAKKIILLVICQILLSSNLIAKPSSFLRFGTNISKFRTENGKSKPGISFGFGNEFPVSVFPNGFWGFTLCLNNKIIYLEKRTWKIYPHETNSQIGLGDIDVNILYLELPIIIGRSIAKKDGSSLNIYTGFEVSVPIKNNTRITNQIFSQDNLTNGGKNYDYIPVDENYITPTTGLLLGASLSSEKISFIVNSAWGLVNTTGFTNLNVKDKIDTFELLLAIWL